jgi:hypothetical protein
LGSVGFKIQIFGVARLLSSSFYEFLDNLAILLSPYFLLFLRASKGMIKFFEDDLESCSLLIPGVFLE